MTIVSVSDFRSNISDYLNRLIYSDEAFLIKKGNKVVAKITKADDSTPKPSIMDLAGLWTNTEAKKVRRVLKEIKNLDPDPKLYDHS